MGQRHTPQLSHRVATWVGFAAARAGWVFLVMVLLTVASGWYTATHLGFHTDTAGLLSPELPFRKLDARYKKAFPQSVDTLVVVVDGSTPEQARAAAGRLAATLVTDTDHFLSVYRPGAGAYFERNGLLFMDLPELERLADRLAEIQPFLGHLTQDMSLTGLTTMLERAIAAQEDGTELELTPILTAFDRAVVARSEGRSRPVSWQRLLEGEADGSAARQLLILQPRLDYSDLLAGAPAMAAVRQAVDRLGLDEQGGVRVRMTGGVALAVAELTSSSEGSARAGLLALGLVLTVLVVGLGSLRLVAASLTTLLVGLILTAGFATLTVGHLNLISVAFAVLYIGLGVDFAIHLCLRQRELITAGSDPSTAMQQAAGGVGVSLVICALTTSVGFFAFIPTAYVGVSELGWIAGGGMIISLLVSLTLLPALLVTWPPPAGRRRESDVSDRPSWMVRRRAVVLMTVATLTGIALWSVPKATFDRDPLHLQDPTTEAVQTYWDLLADDSSARNLVALAADAQAAEALAARFSRLDRVDRVITIADFSPTDDDGQKHDILDELSLLMGPLTAPPGDESPAEAPRQLEALSRLATVLTTAPVAERYPAIGTHLADYLTQLSQLPGGMRAQALQGLQDDLTATLPVNLHLLERALNPQGPGGGTVPADTVRRWVSPQYGYRVEVSPQGETQDLAALREFLTAVQSVEPQVTGAPLQELAAGDAVVVAFVQAFVTALVVILLMLWRLLGRLQDAMLVLVPLLLAALWTVAGMIWLGIPFHFANVIALPLLLGIGVDNGIHLVHRARSGVQNVLSTSTGRGIWVSALTTICGFGSLSLSPHVGTASMGLVLTLGMVTTVFCTLVVLPALLSYRIDNAANKEAM